MIKEIHYADYADKAVTILRSGAFLNTRAAGKDNTMTIAWGAVGFMWGKPALTVMVRKSRYTHELLEKNPVFTVSFPTSDMKQALALCGSQSGRDLNKFAAAKLSAQPGQKVDAPIVGGAGLHFECKVMYKHDMLPENLDEELTNRWYGDQDWHTLYCAEIITAYTEE